MFVPLKKPTNILDLPAIMKTLRDLIEQNTISCTHYTTIITKVLAPATIAHIATVFNIRAYIARDPNPENKQEIGHFAS